MQRKLKVTVIVDTKTGEFKFDHTPGLVAGEVQGILGEACLRWTNLYIVGDNEPSKIQVPSSHYTILPNEDGGFSINRIPRRKHGNKA